MSETMEAVKVHITGTDIAPATRREVTSTLNSYAITSAPVGILNQAPNRKRATLTVVGVAGDTAFLCGSYADAQRGSGMVVAPGMVIWVTNSDPIWLGAGNGTSIVVGVFAEYC